MTQTPLIKNSDKNVRCIYQRGVNKVDVLYGQTIQTNAGLEVVVLVATFLDLYMMIVTGRSDDYKPSAKGI